MKYQISLSRKFAAVLVIFGCSFFLFIKQISKQNNQAVLNLLSEISIAESAFNENKEYVNLILNKIVDQISKNPNDKNHINNVLKSFRILYDSKIGDMLSISMFSWANKDDILIVNSELGVLNENVNLSNRDYLQLTKKNPNKLYLGKPVIGAVSNQYIIPAGIGVFDKRNNYQGSVVMGFDIKSIYQKLFKGRIFDSSNLQIIYANKSDVIESVVNYDQKYLAKINLKNPNIQILKYPSILDSSPILLYKKISDTPYGILISYNNSNQLSLIKEGYLPEFFSALALLLILIYLLKKNFINPITFLLEQAEMIGNGNTNINFPKSKILEINQLSKALFSIKDFIAREDLLKTSLIKAQENINEANQIIYLQEQKHLIDKANSLKNLAGSIAHELRNPLSSISIIQNHIKELLLDKTKDSNSQLLELNSQIAVSIDNANQIIDIILADISEKPIEASDFSYLSTDKVLPEIIRTFGYCNLEEKEKVKLNLKNNFVFKTIDDRFTFIVYNLLKNALYYLKDYPDSIVTIGAEARIIDKEEYDTIFVHDTGPGIPADIIPKLFGDFFTFGKKEGTGLGLAFCRRNMRIMGGDIIVESEQGLNGKSGWTKFSLLFPKLSAEEIALSKTANKAFKKKILLVDDQKTNLMMVKSKIENILPVISCDIALNGKEAINMAKQNNYHLILIDIQMPENNGFITTRKIREFNKNVPIIAFTSLDKNLFLTEINKNSVLESDFHYYLGKPSTDNILYRTISKWLIDIEDKFSYLGNKKEYIKALKGKKALLADDQMVNRLMTKKTLEMYAMIITEASDGKELVEIYKNSLNENGKSDFNIIISDINMPPYNGDEAAKEIRKIEAINNISHKNEIPFIALSGDSKKEDIHHFFKCQITDYFVKGNNPELLLKIIAHYLNKQNNNSLKTDKKKKQKKTNW